MKEEKLRIIPKKNYLILGIILVVSFMLVYYMYMWSISYNETKLNIPIMDKYMEVINYNELDSYLIENNNAIIYVSVLDNMEIRNFEKELKSLLRKREINKDILYLDITNDITVMDKIINEYADGVINYDIPMILVIENGSLKNMCNIKENNYDIDSVKLFIQGIKFLEEDELNG